MSRDRYAQWVAKRRSLLAAAASSPTEVEHFRETLRSLLASRPDLKGERDLFRDPFLVRQFNPRIVKTHPAFLAAVEEGAFPEGSVARIMLKEYLDGASLS